MQGRSKHTNSRTGKNADASAGRSKRPIEPESPAQSENPIRLRATDPAQAEKSRGTRSLVAVLLFALAILAFVYALPTRPTSEPTSSDTAEGLDAFVESDRMSADTSPPGFEDSARAFTHAPPFALPASLHPRGYDRKTYTETWKAVSDASCRELAKELLTELRDSGMELVKADYLDLFGEAWGCTLEDHGEASITIVLIPEEPFKQRGASNPLHMTLIRTAVPEGDFSEEAGEKSGGYA